MTTEIGADTAEEKGGGLQVKKHVLVEVRYRGAVRTLDAVRIDLQRGLHVNLVFLFSTLLASDISAFLSAE